MSRSSKPSRLPSRYSNSHSGTSSQDVAVPDGRVFMLDRIRALAHLIFRDMLSHISPIEHGKYACHSICSYPMEYVTSHAVRYWACAKIITMQSIHVKSRVQHRVTFVKLDTLNLKCMLYTFYVLLARIY